MHGRKNPKDTYIQLSFEQIYIISICIIIIHYYYLL